MASSAVRAKIAAVHARIAAMGDLLLKSASAEEIDTNSERQTHSLLATLSTLQTLDPKQLEDVQFDWILKITEMHSEGKLPTVHFDSIVASLQGITAKRKNTGWRMQNFSAICSYFNQAEWDQFERADANLSGCLRSWVFGRAKQLGCVRASEPTTKLWTSLLLARFHGMNALSMQPCEFDREHDQIKASWKSYNSNCIGEPILGVTDLPCTPAQFKVAHPGIFEAVYGTDPYGFPVICPFNLALVNNINALFSCRGRARAMCTIGSSPFPGQHTPQQSPTQHFALGNDHGGSVRMVEQMQKTLMDQMAAMHRANVETMERVVSNKRAIADADSAGGDSPALFRRSSSTQSGPICDPSAGHQNVAHDRKVMLQMLTDRDHERVQDRDDEHDVESGGSPNAPVLRKQAARSVVAKSTGVKQSAGVMKKPCGHVGGGSVRREATRDQFVAIRASGNSKCFKFGGSESAALKSATKWARDMS